MSPLTNIEYGRFFPGNGLNKIIVENISENWK